MAFLHELKGHGFPIEYSRTLMSYYYSEEIHLNHQLFSLKEDAPEKTRQVFSRKVKEDIRW